MNTDYFPTINLEKTGKNIERLRKARRLPVRELQSYFGFEQPQAIYKWQWGECLPSVDNLFALSKILHVPMQEILVENDQDFNFMEKLKVISYKLRVFVYRLQNYILNIVSDMSFCFFIKFIGINRFPVFNYHMCFLYLRKMLLKDLSRIIHRDRNDSAPGFRGNLKGSVFKRQHAQFITAVAGPLRENTDGYTSLDIINGREDSFQAFLWIFSVQEEAVNTFHPGGQCQVSFHFFFCDISENDIKSENCGEISVYAAGDFTGCRLMFSFVRKRRGDIKDGKTLFHCSGNSIGADFRSVVRRFLDKRKTCGA